VTRTLGKVSPLGLLFGTQQLLLGQLECLHIALQLRQRAIVKVKLKYQTAVVTGFELGA
jgi:hypothetical protein